MGPDGTYICFLVEEGNNIRSRDRTPRPRRGRGCIASSIIRGVGVIPASWHPDVAERAIPVALIPVVLVISVVLAVLVLVLVVILVILAVVLRRALIRPRELLAKEALQLPQATPGHAVLGALAAEGGVARK